MFTSKRLSAAAIAMGLIACSSFAAAQQGGLPLAETPAAKPTESRPLAAAPAAQKAAPTPKPNSIEAEIDRLSAVARGADGKVRVIAPSAALRRALIAKRKGSALPQMKPGKLTRVTNTAEYPFSTVGTYTTGCTGTLIGKNAVLTSAYCFYDLEKKQWKDVKWFAPGYDAEKAPFGNLNIKDTWIPKAFIDEGDQAFAYALSQLEDATAGDKTGWAGFAADKEGRIKQMTYIGYAPQAKPEWSMWQGVCPITSFAPASLGFQCPIKDSDPGAPLLHTFEGEDFPRVLAVQLGPDGKGQWGLRFDDSAVVTLAAWVGEMAGAGTETTTEDTGSDDSGTEDTASNECSCDDRQQPSGTGN